MIDFKRLKPTKEFLDIQAYLYPEKHEIKADGAEYDAGGEFIHSEKQFTIAGEIIKDISMAQEPATLADKVNYPVTTIKSFLKRLRDLDVFNTEEVQIDGKTYVAVSPVTRAFLLVPSKNWSDFKNEYKKFKRQNRF
jgi:hypothetical protein